MEVTATRTIVAQASVRRLHSVHGRKMRVIKLRYGEKSVIERDDKPQHLVQEKMKHPERETEAIGKSIQTESCHGLHQLT